MSEEVKVRRGSLDDLTPDDRNMNKHTSYGMSLIEKSIRKHKFGRSILVDKNDRIIGGNGVTETAASIGATKTIVVETTGDELVVVKRTDVDLDSQQGREMALADNATAVADIEWDAEAVKEIEGEFEIAPEDWGVIAREEWHDDDEDEIERRKGWGNAKDYACPVCDMREKIEIHEHVGYKTISVYKKSEEGIPLDVIKKEPSYIDIFSNSAINLIRGLVGLKVKRDWCLVTTPKRRHKEENFSDNVCKKISLDLGIKYYPDLVIAKSKQRVNPVFELQEQIDENNVIIYDDIITTGSTILATAKLFNSKNTLLIVGINNN